MGRLIFILLLFSSISIFGQEKVDTVSFSFFNSDSIFILAEVIPITPAIEIMIKIENHSNQEIFIDTTYLIPFSLKNKSGVSATGVGISHLTKNDVSEYNIKVIRILPSAKLNLKYIMTPKQYNCDFNNLKTYSFEIKYLFSNDINKDSIKDSALSIPMIWYYFHSRRTIIGNGNYEMLIVE